jgi:hypothetical protein
MALTPQQMLTRMVEKIEPRTGKSWSDWVAVARSAGIDTHRALTTHLKTAHGLNHNEAQWLAWEITDPGRREQYSKPKDLVADLYSGKKAGLRPLYDALLAAGMGVADDVRPNVCKSYTSLATERQFAMINPRTQTAVDLDLSLPDSARSDRLVAQKGSNPNFAQKVRLTDVSEVDDELVRLMGAAAAHARG